MVAVIVRHKMVDDERCIDVRIVARHGQAEELPDGSIVVFGALIVHPPRARGQVRDVILWADGSVYLGRVQRRVM
jgi:hypothetical protein